MRAQPARPLGDPALGSAGLMRAKWSLFWLVLAAVCGTVLFHTSQRVTDTREKIASLEVAAVKERDSIRVLTAEWSYLNAPDRLEKLARAHLGLRPMAGRQFVSATALDAAIQPAAGETAAKSAPKEKVAARVEADDEADAAPQEEKSAVKTSSHKTADKKKSVQKKTVAAKKPSSAPHRDYVYSPHIKGGAYSPPPRSNGFGGLMQSLGVR
jgi:hypothetical protein